MPIDPSQKPIPSRRTYLVLSLINAVALLIALYLVEAHYKPELTDFCNFSTAWNCDLVNKSIYAEIFGIPVAIFGSAAYLFLLIFSLRGLFRDQKKLIPIAWGFTLLSTLFALYLTGIETFVLKTYCVFCVAQQILILVELGILTRMLHQIRTDENP